MTDLPLAGVFRRLAALLYDALLLGAVWMFVTLAIVTALGAPIPPGNGPYQALLLLIGAAFHIVFWVRGGQTLGMRAWRLRLEDHSGANVRLAVAAKRFAAGLLSIACGGLGLLWIWWDRQGQSWHDRIAGTRVVVLPAGKN
jgi:uncharacterized RDD family membrane protein YckC